MCCLHLAQELFYIAKSHCKVLSWGAIHKFRSPDSENVQNGEAFIFHNSEMHHYLGGYKLKL